MRVGTGGRAEAVPAAEELSPGMANYGMTLINASRAIELVPNFDTTDTAVMTDIVTACSALVETWCARTFAVTAYDELIDGSGHPNLLLHNYPVTEIDRVLFNPTQCISIANPKATVSRASWRLDATNLYLESVDSGVLVQHTIARASYTMFSDLVTAINAFASDGWNAVALGIYGNWRLADLYAPQGGSDVRWVGNGYIWHHSYGVPATMSNPTVGEIVSNFGFQRGYQNYRVIYQAGFAVVPPEIQQATAELSAAVYLQREVNPNLQSENLGGYSYANIAEKTFDNLSIASRFALYQYKRTSIAKFKVF